MVDRANNKTCGQSQNPQKPYGLGGLFFPMARLEVENVNLLFESIIRNIDQISFSRYNNHRSCELYV